MSQKRYVPVNPGLSMKILFINDFIAKLVSKLLKKIYNRVHLKSVSKVIDN